MKRHTIKLSIAFLLIACVGADKKVQAQEGKTDTTVITYPTGENAEPGPLLQLPKPRSVVSFAAVNGKTLEKIPQPNFTNTLYGQLNGLMVLQGAGEPGTDGARLISRGIATYDKPDLVYYVDGFQVDYDRYFQYLSAAEIESFAVLKDPVTLATFGMRGANGVIWVTTKRGAKGKPKINAQVVTGLQQALHINKPLGSYDYARLYNIAKSNDGYVLNGRQFTWDPAYTNAQLEAYKNGTGTNTDWYNEVLKKNGHYTDVNVNMYGGSDNARYFISLDYMKHGGLYNVPSDDYTSNAGMQRFNLRSNLDFKFFKIFEAKIDLGGRIEDRRYPNYFGPGLWNNLSRYPSNIYPVKDAATGNWSGTQIYPDNPVASLFATGWYSDHIRVLQANFNLKEDLDFITPGLYLNEAASFYTWTDVNQTNSRDYARFYNGEQTTSNQVSSVRPGGLNPAGQIDWKQAIITAGYNRNFGDHAFSGAANYYVSTLLPVAAAINNHFQNIGARFNYAYKSRYILEAGFGYSGSDYYAPGNHWAFYPAVTAGWVLSKEKFLSDSKIIDLLKVRLSAGKSGNDQTNQGIYLFQQFFRSTNGTVTGNAGNVYNGGLEQGRIGNPEIFAEKSTKYNVGADVSFFHKLSLSADVFLEKRSGIIGTNYAVPGYLGLSYNNTLPLQNLGKVTNKGFEIAVNYADKAGDFTYSAGVMVTYAKNKIDYQAEIPNKNSFSNSTLQAIGTPMGLIADGFYDITDFNTDGTLKAGLPVPGFGPVQPGDLKYKDLDNNNLIDNNDITRIGNPSYPSLYYGFNFSVGYKGFELSGLLQGASGADVNLLGSSYNQVVPFIGNANVYSIANNAWAYYPDQGIDTRSSAAFPRLSTISNSNNYGTSSDFWIKRNNFLRIRNIQLAYSMPSGILKKLHLEKLRVFLTMINPVTWSSLKNDYNIDPEAPNSSYLYPAVKSQNIGISLTF